MKTPKIGPAFLVTAAFVGPGTVITSTLAGANFGFALLWALLFAVFATLILQEMAARLALVTGQGLGENLRSFVANPVLKKLLILLVVAAIVIGNGAYQGGNIAGAALALNAHHTLTFEQLDLWPFIIGLLAFILLFTGSYKLIEKALIVLVGFMSLAFVMTMVMVNPDFTALFKGMFIPSLPSGATLTVIALIGTTVVPYNLFLHASSVCQKWQGVEHLSDVRKDLFISIPIGGLLSVAIVSTAATAFFGSQLQIQSAADIAPALEPLFGDWATWFLSAGLFSAGISSAVTAPLAAAFALSGVLGWQNDIKDKRFKLIWIVILVLGIVPAMTGFRPTQIIWFAQVANGLLLPAMAVFLVFLMNHSSLGEHKNSNKQNIMAGLVVLITLLLSGRSLLSAFGFL